MKSSYLLFLLIPAVLIGCKSTKPSLSAGSSAAIETTPAAVQPGNDTGVGVPANTETPQINYSDQTTWILGYFSLRQLLNEPHGKWYIEGYDGYMPVTEAINTLMNITYQDISIKTVLGTWCPDSRKQVPRFMRIIDICKFPVSSMIFIGVDNQKLSPVGEYEQLNIQRVPTFIFYRKNVEIGRIIENPVTSLEQDMVKILSENK